MRCGGLNTEGARAGIYWVFAVFFFHCHGRRGNDAGGMLHGEDLSFRQHGAKIHGAAMFVVESTPLVS